MMKWIIYSRNFNFRLKGFILKIYLILLGCQVGKGIKCKQFPKFRTIPFKNFEIGNNVNFGYNVTFDIKKSGKIILGNNVNLTQDIVISSVKKVHIDNDTLIAEQVSIRDGDHLYKLGININSQALSFQEIKIGKDVWIGAGVRVLKGSIIEDGCVIACNAVVTQKTQTEKNGVYAGLPIKKIKNRIS
jgi:acetyltransferase-like isoleucine patch superfamily enzyme